VLWDLVLESFGMLNSKTFKHQIPFQGLSRALKNGKNFPRTFKDFQGRVATVCYVAAFYHLNS